MDDRTFDAWTRALGNGTSRRTAIKGLIGGLLGGAAITTKLDRAAAQTPCTNDSDCDPCEHCVGTVATFCESFCTADQQCCNGACYTPGTGTCCSERDCPPPENGCTVVECYDFECQYGSGCPAGRQCCFDSYCAACCSDADCGSCEYCVAGQCVAGEQCCTSDDCDPCQDCSFGTCVDTCDANEQCCSGVCFPGGVPCCFEVGQTCVTAGGEVPCCDDLLCCPNGACAECCGDGNCGDCEICDNGTCVPTAECCSDDDCGACERCSRGLCISECTEVSECCFGTCVAPDTCCASQDDTCLPYENELYPPCCDELFCCSSGEGYACTECCEDADCGDPCQRCDAGACVVVEPCCLEQGVSCEVTATDGDVGCCEGLQCCPTPGGVALCQQCCDDSDCGTCGSCDNGICGGCGTDEKCCEGRCIPLDDCCSDSDCGPCSFCSEGTCEQAECCDDSDCDPCEICILGVCEAGPGQCCTDDQCPCGTCYRGVCLDDCETGEECCRDECVAIGTCCQEWGETCAVTGGPGGQGNCCEDLLCCPAGEGGVCAECCDDSDCPDCWRCDGGVCAYQCGRGQECCDGECVPFGDCCRHEGETCGLVKVAGGDASEQFDCCDGLVCCEHADGESSICAECCVDADCGHGGHCHHGECTYPHVCQHDHECPKGTCCCKDGTCSRKCCHHPHPKPPQPKPSGGTTLPNTGTGDTAETGGLLGAAALAGAAALLAARTLRDRQNAAETSELPPAD